MPNKHPPLEGGGNLQSTRVSERKRTMTKGHEKVKTDFQPLRLCRRWIVD